MSFFRYQLTQKLGSIGKKNSQEPARKIPDSLTPIEGARPFPVSEIRNRLAEAVDLAGGQSAWARKTGVPRSTVSEVLSQKRDMPESIINALGYIVMPMCVPARKGMNR